MLRGMILFCVGAWCLQQQATLPAMGGALALMAAMLTRVLAAPRSTHLRILSDMFLALAAGYYWAAGVAHVNLSRQLPSHWEGVDIHLEGVVAEMPQRLSDAQRFIFDVERVHTPQAPRLEKIQLSWYGRSDAEKPAVSAGERWRLTVRLKRPHGTLNPFGFDRRYWSLEHGIQGLGYVRERAPIEKLSDRVVSPMYLVEQAREHLRERVGHAVGFDAAASVVAALAVGDQSAIAPADWRLFAATGVSHLMSISGPHITMLSGLSAWWVALAWRRSLRLTQRLPARRAGLLAGVIVAWSYACIAGLGVPALRTVVMLSVAAAGFWHSRRFAPAQILGLAAVTVVLLDPFAVIAVGFWLSFGAVGVLIFFGSGRLQSGGWVRQWIRSQWAITIGLAPLLLLMFQQMSLLSPVANAFAIPLIGLLVVPLTLAGVVLPGDGGLWLAHRFCALCLLLLRSLEGMPVAVWQQARPPDWSIALALIGALWALAPRGFPRRWMGVLALLPMALVAAPGPRPGESWVDVIDVGQGLAVLVRTHAHALLYDTGPSYGLDHDAGQSIVLPHLRALGVFRLDALVLSHDDDDHVGGAPAILDGLPVGWMTSSLGAGHGLHARVPRSLPCQRGQSWQWDGIAFQILSPDHEASHPSVRKDNDRSCVLRIVSGTRAPLLPGDIEAVTERRLVANDPQSLRADVLLAPHHGSGTSSTSAFLGAVAPTHVIVSSGYGNRYGHPTDEVMERYDAAQAQVLRADRVGAVQIRLAGEDLTVSNWRDQHRRYWYD